MPLSPKFSLSEKPLLILLAGVQFTHIMDFMIMMPLGPMLMRELSLSASEFSALIAAYTIMAGIVGLLTAPFIDRFDRRTVLLTCYVGFIAGTLGCALAESAPSLLIARAICGAFGGVSNATILAIVGDLVPAQRRGAAMGIVMTSFSAAAAFGVPFGLFLAQQSRWETPFYLLAGLALLVEGLLFLSLPHVRGHLAGGPPPSFRNFLSLLADSNAWRALALMVALVFGHFTIIPFLSPHLVFNLKLPENYLALVYVIGGALTIVTAPLIGRLSDRLGRARVFSVLVSMAALVILALTHAGPLPAAGTLALTGLFFIFASGRYVPAQAVLTSAVPAVRRGAFMSLVACTRDLCTGVAAIMAGRLVVRAPEALLNVGWLGAIAAFVSLISIWLIHRVKLVHDAPPVAQTAIPVSAAAEGQGSGLRFFPKNLQLYATSRFNVLSGTTRVSMAREDVPPSPTPPLVQVFHSLREFLRRNAFQMALGRGDAPLLTTMEANTIHIFGWRLGARTMAAVAELRSSTALGNLGAKNAVYDVMGGVCIEVAPLQGVDPAGLAARLTECGFVTAMQPPIRREPIPFAGIDLRANTSSDVHEAVAVGQGIVQQKTSVFRISTSSFQSLAPPTSPTV